MWNPVDVPFQRATKSVPTPTAVEIRASTDVVHESFATKVITLGEQMVVKFGKGVHEREGQALLFLEQYAPQVPAPRLYAMFRDSKQLFLVMQRMAGASLDEVWPNLNDSEKDLVTSQLGRIFQDLHAVQCPWPDFFGSLDGTGVHHYLFFDQSGAQEHLGPFSSEAAFVKGLTDNYRALKTRNGHSVLKADYYETHLKKVLKDHRAVLTHGDLQRKNIMVATTTGDTSPERARDLHISLVDWEMAGWLPDFWEYFCASLLFDYIGWEDDWCWRVGHFLPVPLAETAVMREFDKDMGF